MKRTPILRASLMILVLGLCGSLSAEETTNEKVETQTREIVDSVKDNYRDLEDKGCEMVNGKLQCLGKKIKHKARTLKEKSKTKAKEIENKMDN
ncbi:MAG: hypothetical protein IPM97_07880 [Bdellovibrionaceae bacterium]|nr:hypothetical protein [Pseudobdellovibrionaceae bacterium]